ncbi:MAG TPA: glycosyltransferase family 9 protein [Pyrinomonadaceae bacterium]|jgi:predicted lipopolysaccharide heptosyltransferase III|nr:glycosyltransferase family 9 protein [Pyrinomonadaceae bacterium]
MPAVDWSQVKRILVVKLRSIGDTVLATPSLIALKRHAPHAEIDILLEEWVAPVLDGFDAVDNVFTVGKSAPERLKMAWTLRRRRYDVAFNLHGGTTSTFFTRFSGAKHRFGNAEYQYPFLYNHLLSAPADFWDREKMHSAEQQLALIGFAGVPVDDLPKSRLAVTASASEAIDRRLEGAAIRDKRSAIALIHPGTAFFTKQWPVANFARLAEYLASQGFSVVAAGSGAESPILEALRRAAALPVTTFDDLTLPEITALASKARIFIGNDSGIAHIAAAVQTPSVVIFGSSNRVHWRPWTDAPNEIVFNPFDCQPCPGYECKEFGAPRCILEIPPSAVFTALERVLSASNS